MAKISINDLIEYDFENAQKGNTVIVATINYGELQFYNLCLVKVKSVSPKRGDVTLDNGLKFSKTGYEYGREPFCRIHHRVFVENEESREMAKAYTAQRKIVRKIMVQIQEINVERLMKTTSDNCKKLSLALDEILEEVTSNGRE